jgi:hypothetical protein
MLSNADCSGGLHMWKMRDNTTMLTLTIQKEKMQRRQIESKNKGRGEKERIFSQRTTLEY